MDDEYFTDADRENLYGYEPGEWSDPAEYICEYAEDWRDDDMMVY
jgi:hypothetical protein